MSLLSITIESLLSLFQHTATPHTLGRTTLLIIRLCCYSLLYLGYLITHQSCILGPIYNHYYSSIHDFRKCVTGIFILVMDYDIIHDSGILDIFTSSIHYLQELSLCGPLHVPRGICFQGVLCHDIRWVIFTLNIIYINIFIFHHFLQKMITDVNLFCTNTNLPVLRSEKLHLDHTHI